MQNNQLALTFRYLRREIQAANRLALRFGERGDVAPDTPTNPDTPQQPENRHITIGMDFYAPTSSASSLNACLSANHFARPLAFDYVAHDVDVIKISSCLNVQSELLLLLDNSHSIRWQNAPELSGCLKTPIAHAIELSQSSLTHWQTSEKQHGCADVAISEMARQSNCADTSITGSGSLKNCTAWAYAGGAVKSCQRTNVGVAPQTPCEWYPIILPPPESDNKRPCGEKPASNSLPLNLSRHKVPYDPRMLPLPLSCNRDFKQIPPLVTYMIVNKISAKSGDLVLNLLSASAKADMNGYCWLCDVALPPDDFNALKMQQNAGQETVIELQINQDVFVFMAENVSDNRQFAQRSYTISGRSLTAKLGADYALNRGGVIEQDLYASQIAQQQLANTGFTVEWNAVDWLIPSGTYTLTDKTPIAVLQDLATACGAFVYSHPAERKLFVLPRWRVAAWNVATASPALTVPSNVIVQISGSASVQTQCHGVMIIGTSQNAKGANVRRSGTDGLPEASSKSHAAYTDYMVCEAAAIAALSDTGTHKTETVTLPVAHKYNLPIAEIGRVWQFVENGNAWNAVIQGVSIRVAVEKDVPVVKQTVTADRYLGT